MQEAWGFINLMAIPLQSSTGLCQFFCPVLHATLSLSSLAKQNFSHARGSLQKLSGNHYPIKAMIRILRWQWLELDWVELGKTPSQEWQQSLETSRFSVSQSILQDTSQLFRQQSSLNTCQTPDTGLGNRATDRDSKAKPPVLLSIKFSGESRE